MAKKTKKKITKTVTKKEYPTLLSSTHEEGSIIEVGVYNADGSKLLKRKYKTASAYTTEDTEDSCLIEASKRKLTMIPSQSPVSLEVYGSLGKSSNPNGSWRNEITYDHPSASYKEPHWGIDNHWDIYKTLNPNEGRWIRFKSSYMKYFIRIKRLCMRYFRKINLFSRLIGHFDCADQSRYEKRLLDKLHRVTKERKNVIVKWM